MKIETGKTYNLRGGGVATIINQHPSCRGWFWGFDGEAERSWQESGHWAPSKYENDLDLISEVTPPAFVSIPNDHLIRALLDGETIQWQHASKEWIDFRSPRAALVDIAQETSNCRVKPTPKPNSVTWHPVYTDGISTGWPSKDSATFEDSVSVLRVEIDYNDENNPVLVSASLEKP